MPIPQVLREMQARHHHMAVVDDDLGLAIGIVTVEGIIEQLVGHVPDEVSDKDSYIRADGDGRHIVSGDAPIIDLNARLGVDVNHPSDADTLAGLLVNQLGRRLAVGDQIDLGDLHAQVLAVVGNRATRILVSVQCHLSPDEEPEHDAS